MTVPDPASVPTRAETTAAATADGSINVVVAGDSSPDGVDIDGGYVGPSAGDLGRLAAATEAVSEAGGRLHYPTPDLEADGPWMVVEPLDGFISTVHTGTGRVEVTMAVERGGVDARLRSVRERLGLVVDAARPSHDHYPVSDDTNGVFTRGMTTYALESVSVGQGHSVVELSVSTTPETTAELVESTFEVLEPVSDATFEPLDPVERSAPSPAVRDAVERAHTSVLDDWQYEWAPEPTVFSALPTDEKVALGTGTPTAGLSADAYGTCVDLLTACVGAIDA